MANNKNQFKDTLNLPKTAFPMKANLDQNEPITLKRWQKENLYQQICEHNDGKETFLFHDGPPYANGDIHIGHLLNKVLKDIVVRSQNKLDKQCEFIPGWDCHGLPIEHRVMTDMSEEKRQKLDGLEDDTRRIAIRNECKKYAEKFIKLQATQMQRLLTIGDYNTPYLTMNPGFESKVISVFADLIKEGVVYRQLKPVHWSIANQTALAEAELEYEDKIDTSVFVKFPLNTAPAVFSDIENLSLLIWTTTPWTLPANLAVAVHETYEYAVVEWPAQPPVIVAKDLIKSIENTCSLNDAKILATCTGKDLLNITYQHPFCNRTGTIAHAPFVTLEDGSGLVHIAPGHGTDDYQVGQALKLDVYCPVQADGTYDNTVPSWLEGKSIWTANDDIIEHLRQNHHLLYAYEFSHSYPHDWRSKTPVIFRSTEQWFISVDKETKSSKKSIRNMAVDNIENNIKFTPEWGQNRLRGMLESRPDWCISRQRSWGLPIPAFKTADDQIFLTEASTRAIAKVFETEGSDAWFKKSPADLLVYYIPSDDADAPAGLKIDTLSKLYDIFDVWFESGSSWDAVMNCKTSQEQIDLYLEGSDQHRGWFHLSLLTSLGAQQKAPYKHILTHGFIVDKEGKKMSKSVGNTINVETLLKKYGAEVARWWVSSLAYENDIKVDLSYFDVAGDGYRKIRNTIRFLLSNIDDLDGKTPLTNASRQAFCDSLPAHSPEAYILSELSACIEACKADYSTFQYRNLHQRLYNFCNQDLSSFYCMMSKDRLYCDAPNSARRRQSQRCIHIIADALIHLLAPILPHTAEETYKSLYPDHDELKTHLDAIPTVNCSASSDWALVIQTRQDVQRALENEKENGIENSLDAGVNCPNPEGKLSPFQDDLDDIFGVSNVELDTTATTITIEDRRDAPSCERSWKRDKTVKKREDGTYLSDRDAAAIKVVTA